MNKLKVLLLTTSFPINNSSRSGIFVLKMIKNMPHDLLVTVLVPDGNENNQDHRECSTVYFRYAPKKWQIIAHAPGGIFSALKRNRYLLLILPFFFSLYIIYCLKHSMKNDILHAKWSVNGVVANIAGFFFRKPVITSLLGSDVNLIDKSLIMKIIMHICMKYSKYIVTVGPSLKKTVDNAFPKFKDKVIVIPYGIDHFFFEAGEKRDYAATPPRLLYAGNLISGKGVQVILEAAAALSETDWLLDIVGDGPEREKLEAFCQEKNLSGKVRFHGAVAPERMPDFMAKADIFVFASFAEGRPNVVLEAMAAGLPVLASSIPAVHDLITPGKEGLLFPPGDARQLAVQMTLLLSSPAERRSMGEQARRTIAALGLSWEETGRRYAALYEAALSSANPPPCPAPSH